jgi:Mrp family chromosome partitioning ATPase
MERIKQAIEKVKAQRPGKAGAQGQSRQGTLGTAFMPRAFQGRAELGEITYESTRVVRLKADHLEKNRIVAFNKNDPKSISFDLLRTYVLQKMEENGWRTLAITSPTPGSGKTVVAINLAMSIAQQPNKSALLVDFDLRRPKVGAYLGLPMEKSINDVLEGTAELPEALVSPDMQRLVVLPTKNPVRKSAETLSTSKIGEMVKDMRDRYDSRIVIFDLPPLLAADDAVIAVPHIDCVLMVVANGMSTKREIEDGLHHIPPAKLVGTVLNRAESDAIPYYYA